MDKSFDSPSDSSPRSFAHLLLGIGVGALVGVAVAILLAPQSGTETREDLSELPGRVKERADEMVSELKRNLDDLSVKSKELVDSTRERIEAAIEAGKEAAHEKKEELEAQVNSEESV